MVKFRCATRLIVFNEAHLLRILSKYACYYNEVAWQECTLHTPDRAVSRHYRAAELWWATPSIRTNEFSGSQRASAARTTGYLACKISACIPQSEKPADYQ